MGFNSGFKGLNTFWLNTSLVQQLLSPEGQSVEPWESAEKECCFGNFGALNGQVLFPF